MDRKTKNVFARFFIHIFRIDVQKMGRKVWNDLDAQLPEAVGVIKKDADRIFLFGRKIRKLDFVHYYALRCFLEKELHELTCNFAEFSSTTLESYESKQIQIFRIHLKLM